MSLAVSPPVSVINDWLQESRKPVKVYVFQCPECQMPSRPQNVLRITCETCGCTGTKDQFSAKVAA